MRSGSWYHKRDAATVSWFGAYSNFGCVRWKQKFLMLAYRRLQGSWQMKRLYLHFGGRKQKACLDLVDKRHGLSVGRRIFVKSAGRICNRLNVQRVKSIFKEGSCTCSSRSLFFVGGRALRAKQEILVSRPGKRKRGQRCRNVDYYWSGELSRAVAMNICRCCYLLEAPRVQWQCQVARPLATVGSSTWNGRGS